MNLKNLQTRTIAGIIYIALVLLGILGGEISFAIIFALLLGLALYELYRLTEKEKSNLAYKMINIISGIAIFLSTLMPISVGSISLPFVIFIIYIIALLVATVFDKKGNQLKRSVSSIFGQVYITIPLIILSFIMAIDYQIALAIFILIWVNDTAAYVVGSLFGKHKLIERISPKKTIEGFVGGIAFTIIAGLIFAKLNPTHDFLYWGIFALIVSIFGTIGDLFESLIKRTYNVKDSGNIIPGHGGILDRIDSILLAIPAIYIYILIYSSI